MLVKFNEAVDNALFGFEMENVKGVKILSINNFLMDKVVKHIDKGEILEVNFKLNFPKICRGEYLISPSVAMGNQNSHVVIERIHNFMLVTIDNDGYNISILDIDSDIEFIKRSKENIKFL